MLAPGDTVRIGATTFALEASRGGARGGASRCARARRPPPAEPAPSRRPSLRPAAPAAPRRRPAPALATAAVGAPREPFGTYLAPESAHHGGGIQSRQRGPMLVTYAIVLAVAVALVIYFAYAYA